jgi:hypothetical protein
LTQGQRDRALQAYSDALTYALADAAFRQPIQAQIHIIPQRLLIAWSDHVIDFSSKLFTGLNKTNL